MISSAHTRDDDREVSLLARDQYMREVRWITKMTNEEEEQLTELLVRGRVEKQQACPDWQVLEQARYARERLVEGFQCVVIAIAASYARKYPKLDMLDDLIQEGNLGLLEAIEECEYLPGKHFVGLASPCITHAICRALQRRHGLHVTDHLRKWFQRVRHAYKRLHERSVERPSVAELAREMGAREEEVREVLEWQRACQVESLQGRLAEEQDEDELGVMSLYEGTPASDEGASSRLQHLVTQACEQVLTARQQTVIGMRFGVGSYDGPFLTYHEAGAELGVTYSSVYQMEMTARRRFAKVFATQVGGGAHGCSV